MRAIVNYNVLGQTKREKNVSVAVIADPTDEEYYAYRGKLQNIGTYKGQVLFAPLGEDAECIHLVKVIEKSDW